MSFRDIVDIVATELGLGTSSDDELNLLRRLCSRAAREIYKFDDLPGSLKEVILSVPANKQVSLPSFIGDIRAMREYTYGIKIELNDMRPRYHYNSWPTYWRKWRLKYGNATYREITNGGPLFFAPKKLVTVSGTPVPFTISITGKNDDSSLVNEDVVINQSTQQTVNSFTEIKEIQRQVRGTYDLAVLDTNGIELAVLENHQLKTSYTIADISQYPFLYVPDLLEQYIEILYKQPLYPFYDMADSFPCDGYDDAIAMKACEIHFRPQDGKKDKVAYYSEQSQHFVNIQTHNVEGAIQKTIQFSPSPYSSYFRPRRSYIGFQYPS